MSCTVKYCRFPESHLTCAHRCGKCGKYGHGQMECGREPDLRRLALASDRVVAVATPCTVPDCPYSWSHTVDAHHCSVCGARGDGCQCIKTLDSILFKQCPLCRISSDVDVNRVIFTGADCTVCLNSGPVVLFSGCRHAAVCASCVRLL